MRAASGAVFGGALIVGDSDIATGQSGESWPQHGYDAANTGYARENTSPVANISVAWEFGAGSSSPAVVDGSVYVGSGDFHALDADDGAERWQFELENPTLYPPPAVVDGTVFGLDGDSNVFALNTDDGSERWRFEVDDRPQSNFTVWNDTIYVANGSRLCALNTSDGTERWCLETDGPIGSAPTVSDDILYISYGESGSNDDFYALDAADGSRIWRFETGLTFSSTPAVVEETVYFGSADTLFAVDTGGGTERWRFETDGSLYSSPAVADGTVYFGSDGGSLYAADTESGAERWRFETGGRVASPVVAGNTVYVGSQDTYLYALDATEGTERWRFRAGGRVNSPAIVDGSVYVGSDNALYALTGDTPEQVSTETRSTNTRPTTERTRTAPVTTNGGAGDGGGDAGGGSNADGFADDSDLVVPLAGALAAGAGGGLWYWRRDGGGPAGSARSDAETGTGSGGSVESGPVLGTITPPSTHSEDDAVSPNTHVPADAPDTVPRAPDLSVSYDELTEGPPIGSGGNADVTKATLATADGDVTVAIKKPRMRGTLHTDTVERLLREAETWSKLDDHDHIVGVLDYGAEPIPWIAMEYMDGGDIGDRAGRLNFAQAVWTAIATVRGVRHAHRRGVAHLDLKPANVLFRSTDGAWDAPKVADWGLSKHLLEHSKSVEGLSPQYAAPEQFDDEYGVADDITDVYQLGTVLYELFTGRPPFEGSSTEIMGQVLNETPTPPSEIADVPPALDDVLLTALAKKKSHRYQSTLLLRNDLQELYQDH
ncbi:hypothetical protein GCM10027355_19560 [Haloplanus salinarum]